MQEKGNGKAVEGLPVIHRIARAANEEFTATSNDRNGLAPIQSGWDPYEVWRDRVKGSDGSGAERAQDPPL